MPMLRTPIVEEDIRFVLATCSNELQALSGKTLLITGGSGFVGSYLVESIIAFNEAHPGAPCHLLLPTRCIAGTQGKWPHLFGVAHISWFEWDGNALNPPAHSCDYIIHSASPTDTAKIMADPFGTMTSIAHTTEHVLTYAKQASVTRLLYMSSGAIYGVQPGNLAAFPESYSGSPDLTDPRSCYGEAKRYSELLCHLSGVPTVVARLFSCVGPYQDLSGSYAMTDFISQAKSKRHIQIQSDGSAMRTFLYSSDLTNALWKLLLTGNHGSVYNVGSDTQVVSVLELANLVSDLVGETTVETMKKDNLPGNNRSRYIPDISRLREIYSPQIDLRQGISRTIQSHYGFH